MKTLLLIIIFLPGILFSQQNREWEQKISESGGNGGKKVLVGQYGSIYVLASDGTHDIHLIKYNPDGVKQWEKFYDGNNSSTVGEPSDMKLFTDDNIYVTGTVSNVVTGLDYVTIRYDSNGARLWTLETNSTFDEYATSIDVDIAGNAYVTGRVIVTIPTDYDCVTKKYSSTGTFLWSVNYDSAGNWSPYIKTDASGNVYIASITNTLSGSKPVLRKYNTSGVLQFSRTFAQNGYPTGITMDGSNNLIMSATLFTNNANFGIGKFNATDGTQQWLVIYDGPGSDYYDNPVSPVVDAAGFIYVTGNSESLSSVTGSDALTMKISPLGAIQWLERYDYSLPVSNDAGGDIAVDLSGNVYVACLTDGFNDANITLVKYNSSGIKQWSTNYQGQQSGSWDQPGSICINPAGELYLTGVTDLNILTLKYSNFSSSDLRLNLSVIPQGFYNIVTGMMNMKDDFTIHIRDDDSPYGIIETKTAKVDDVTFTGTYMFTNFSSSGTYYIEVQHRNSMLTWSTAGGTFLERGTTNYYDFTTSQSKAYGQNQEIISGKACIYSGEIVHDGIIDIEDLMSVYLANLYGITGYVDWDITGDGFVDNEDVLLCYINMMKVVEIARP